MNYILIREEANNYKFSFSRYFIFKISLPKCAKWFIFNSTSSRILHTITISDFYLSTRIVFSIPLPWENKSTSSRIFNTTARRWPVLFYLEFHGIENFLLKCAKWLIIILHQRELIIFHPPTRENKLSVSYCSTHYYFIQKKLIILPTTRRYPLFSYFKFYVIENF